MEVQRKKGGKNFFNRTGILAVGLMVLVVAVAGCTSSPNFSNEQKDQQTSPEKMQMPPSMSGYLFILDTSEKVYLTHSYVKTGEIFVKKEGKNRSVYHFSEKLDKLLNEHQVKKISKRDGIVPENGDFISKEKARDNASKELRSEGFSSWLNITSDSDKNLELGQGVLTHYSNEAYYVFPVFRNNSPLAVISLDASQGDVAGSARLNSWTAKKEATDILTSSYNISEKNIEQNYRVIYHIKDARSAVEILGE